MSTYIEYLIRASVYLLLFGSAYYLLFSRSRRLVFNRSYLLFSFILSLVLAIPAGIEIPLVGAGASDTSIFLLPEVIVVAGSGVPAATHWFSSLFATLSWWQIFAGVFTLLLLMVLAARLLKLLNIVKSHTIENHDDVQIVWLKKPHSPFSFFRWVFIPSEVKGTPHFDKILCHERAHHKLNHSWDVVFMELMRLVFWFHPFYYLLRKELQNIHEFEADSQVLRSFSRVDYQKSLMEFAMGLSYIPVTNPFNISIIHKRFIMMNTTSRQSLKRLLIKLFVLLPVVGVVFFIQSCDFQQQSAEETTTAVVDEVDETTEDIANAYQDDPIFTIVEEHPKFPGGDAALMQFLQSNLRYPREAMQNGIQGNVFVTFVVEPDGSITDVKILRGVGGGLDEEAIRVVNAMPLWVPGKQSGDEVRVQFNLPIRFVLN
ncbi:MAG: TonB family protein [Bacteroidales bacterium]|nr:TonB family protein [Bacteroidales bacterium]